MSAKDAEVIIVIGANPIENHPVAATFFKNAVERGAKLVVMDPRGHALKRFATHMLQFKPGRDVAMLNAMLNVIITEGLYDQQYVQANTEDFDELKEHVKDYSPERMAEICRLAYDRKLLDSAGGNLTVRAGERVYMSRSYAGAKQQWRLRPEEFLVLDREGNILAGEGEISREGAVHTSSARSRRRMVARPASGCSRGMIAFIRSSPSSCRAVSS